MLLIIQRFKTWILRSGMTNNEMGWYILIFSSIERTLIKTSGYRRKKVIELSADQFLW